MAPENLWIIEKIARYANEKWLRIQRKNNMYLKIQFDQAFIISEHTLLDIFKLQNIKGYLKGNVIIIVHEYQGAQRIIKIKFSNPPSEMEEIIKALGIFNPIQDIEKTHLNSEIDSETYVTFQQLFQQEMLRKSLCIFDRINPEDISIDLLKTLVSEPTFPEMVDQVERIMQQYLHLL